MRNMSNIPKLQAHTKRSSCCSMKVAAHNKELSGKALTLQTALLAPLPRAHAPSPRGFCLCGGFGSRLVRVSGTKRVVFDRKKAECKVWVWYEINAPSKKNAQEAWRQNTRTRKSLVGPKANSSHGGTQERWSGLHFYYAAKNHDTLLLYTAFTPTDSVRKWKELFLNLIKMLIT